jgi:ribose-phosphate pyrophosphokinase
MELLVIIDALKRASARRVNVIIPYYGYGRQDQKDKPRVPIAAKVVADLLGIAGADHVITIDLHADQIQGFFRIPVDHLFGTTALIEAIREGLTGDEIVVTPDSGGAARARFFAERLKLDLALMDYRENGAYPKIVGNVKGRRVIILDDMIDTGKTILRTAIAAREALAGSIEACVVHPVLSGVGVVEKIEDSAIEKLVVTDTIPLCQTAMACEKIQVVSVAPMLAEVIKRVHFEESISSIFKEC